MSDIPPVPPVPPANQPPPPPPPQPDPLAQLNTWAQSIGAKEKAEGKQAVLKDIKEKLGFDSLEDAAAFVEAAKTKEREGMDEAERKLAEAADKDAAADRKVAAANEKALRADKLSGLIVAGLDKKAAAVLVDLVKVDPNDYDDDKIQDAIKELKEAMPQLFPTDDGSGNGNDDDAPSQGGPSDSKPRGSQPPTPTGKTAKDRAKGRLASRHPELAKKE